jgi:tritrans,polycis-undecaprenyl-diphosphate synthase [geranylgeranyl-diphosphate specific]
LNVALAYGGRDVLLSAARRIARQAAEGELDPSSVDPEVVAAELYDRPFADVDLLVRSGGECRTSNFLPWYAVGAEAPMAVVDSYWPEFSRLDFLRALRGYDKYGGAKADRQPRSGSKSRIRQLSELVSGLRSVLYSFRR